MNQAMFGASVSHMIEFIIKFVVFYVTKKR